MGRFSPQARPYTNDQYRRMETGLADSIAGAENLYDTRKRQDTKDRQADERIDVSERHATVSENAGMRADASAEYEWGYHRGQQPGEGGQSVDPGMGQTIPPVAGMPTIEGQGSPITPQPQFSVKGSGVPGDMNGAMDGRDTDPQQPYWIEDESMADRKKEAARQRAIENLMAAEGYPFIDRAGTEESKRATAESMYEGFVPGEDPRTVDMREEMLRGGRKTGGGGVTGAERKVFADRALNRAYEMLRDDPDLGRMEAIRRAEIEASQAAGYEVSVSMEDFLGLEEQSGKRTTSDRDFYMKWGKWPEEVKREEPQKPMKEYPPGYKHQLPPDPGTYTHRLPPR